MKLDKRLANAWVVLGHVLAAQEESEHAISAFRSASRLLPGDHLPLVYMAKELVRTNYLSLVRVCGCVCGYGCGCGYRCRWMAVGNTSHVCAVGYDA